MRRTILAAAVAVAAIAGGGAAVAATGLGDPQEESKAIVDDAAEQLGVEPGELSDALKQALQNRVDAAVAAGRLTEEEGAALKERIQAEEYPLLGGPGLGHHGGRGLHHLDAAAEYLGLTEAELRTRLAGGQTLAQVAQAEGKTVDGLVAALVADEKAELDEAVADGRITQDRADEHLAQAEERLRALVDGTLPGRGPRGFGFGPRDGGGSSSDDAVYAGPTI
jgi:hypothetical protein